jgi:hypothetical protein
MEQDRSNWPSRLGLSPHPIPDPRSSRLWHVQVEVSVVAKTAPEARRRAALFLEEGKGTGWCNVRPEEDWGL